MAMFPHYAHTFGYYAQRSNSGSLPRRLPDFFGVHLSLMSFKIS